MVTSSKPTFGGQMNDDAGPRIGDESSSSLLGGQIAFGFFSAPLGERTSQMTILFGGDTQPAIRRSEQNVADESDGEAKDMDSTTFQSYHRVTEWSKAMERQAIRKMFTTMRAVCAS